MAWQPTLYSLGAFAGAGVCAMVLGLAWRQCTEPAARAFIALMLGFGGRSYLSGIQLGFGTPAEQRFWQRVALAVGGTILTLWFVFTGGDGNAAPARDRNRPLSRLLEYLDGRGTVTFDANEPRGSIVTLTLQDASSADRQRN